ncbi:MAG: AP2 domain-containing protein [Caldilineaceae bacterium]
MGTKASTRKLPVDLRKYDMRNIYRHDKIRMYGWWLKVQRNGEQLSKFFADATYDHSPERALQAAIAERDEFIRRHLESKPPLPFRERTLSNNMTGVNGVSFAASEGRRGAFVASWKLPDGRNKNKKFNINKYGFHKALQLAIDARRAWEEEMRQSYLNGNGSTAAHEGACHD